MSKCLIIFPPQWSPFSPHLAPVSISANIRRKYHKCDVRDLNIEFYLEVLKKDFIENILVKSVESLPELREELKTIIIEGKSPNEYTFEEQIKAKKLLKFNEIREKKLDESKQVIDNVESAVQLLHDKEAFYHLPLAANSVGIINKALEIVALSEFPQELSLYYFKNRLVKLNYENILKYCSTDNLFSKILKQKAVEIIKNKYDFIGISLSSSSQLLAFLTLAKILKDRTKHALAAIIFQE